MFVTVVAMIVTVVLLCLLLLCRYVCYCCVAMIATIIAMFVTAVVVVEQACGGILENWGGRDDRPVAMLVDRKIDFLSPNLLTSDTSTLQLAASSRCCLISLPTMDACKLKVSCRSYVIPRNFWFGLCWICCLLRHRAGRHIASCVFVAKKERSDFWADTSISHDGHQLATASSPFSSLRVALSMSVSCVHTATLSFSPTAPTMTPDQLCRRGKGAPTGPIHVGRLVSWSQLCF